LLQERKSRKKGGVPSAAKKKRRKEKRGGISEKTKQSAKERPVMDLAERLIRYVMLRPDAGCRKKKEKENLGEAQEGEQLWHRVGEGTTRYNPARKGMGAEKKENKRGK